MGVIVFDIDGTIADNSHRQHFLKGDKKDWKSYNELMPFDTVHHDIVDLLVILSQTDDIILCTGREEVYRLITWTWLEKNLIADSVFDLYMRPEKDYRSDAIVKVELLEKITEHYARPRLWFDDRQQVVDAIRAQGIRVLQVAPGDI